jgi:hypothetical protein
MLFLQSSMKYKRLEPQKTRPGSPGPGQKKPVFQEPSLDEVFRHQLFLAVRKLAERLTAPAKECGSSAGK